MYNYMSNIIELITKSENFNEFKMGLEEFPDIEVKEKEPETVNDDRAIIFSESCKSIIINKSNMTILGSQFNNIIYNDDAIELIGSLNWSNIKVSECIEGTLLLVYYYNDSWRISTRRCLDAKDSYWVKDNSYEDMFNSCISEDFYEELDKRFCYHFILVHYLNRNIVEVSEGTKMIYHVLTTTSGEKGVYEVPYIIPGVRVPKTFDFGCLEDAIGYVRVVGEMDKRNKRISSEGLFFKYSLDNVPLFLKLQTDIYQEIAKYKPNTNNLQEVLLEFYKKDKLGMFSPYFGNTTDYSIIIKLLSRKLLDLYHTTRKRNSELYDGLPGIYKKILYDLHGQFINSKKSITIHMVYNHLKNNLTAHELNLAILGQY